MMQTVEVLCHVDTCTRPGCSPETGCKGHVSRERAPGNIRAKAEALVAEAARWGLVLTIEQQPLRPLAMGHYTTVVDVRQARTNSSGAFTMPIAGTVQPPARAFRLTLRMDADTRADLTSGLVNFAGEVERERLTVGVSGGVHSGAIYELLNDPAQTHERYFQQVREYLKADKSA